MRMYLTANALRVGIEAEDVEPFGPFVRTSNGLIPAGHAHLRLNDAVAEVHVMRSTKIAYHEEVIAYHESEIARLKAMTFDTVREG